MSAILLISITLFAASFLQALAGFGFALLAVPLLTLSLPITVVVPAILILSTMTNLSVAVDKRKTLRLRDIAPLLIAGIIGIPIGVKLLVLINPDFLKILVGLIVVVTATCLYFDKKISFRNKKLAFTITGLTSGIMGGSLSMSGPPIILFLTNEGYDRDTFRTNITFYGIITNLVAITSMQLSGLLTQQVWHVVAIGLLALATGSTLGILASAKINEQHFRKFVLIMLALMSSITAINGLQDFW